MRIGLNCVFLVPGEIGGQEIYARELVAELAQLDMDVTAFLPRNGIDEDLPVTRKVLVDVDARDRRQWVYGEQVLLPRLAKRQNIDVLHSLANTAPLRGPYRRVVTIHDLSARLVPGAHSRLNALAMGRLLIPLAARTAHRVITDSRSSRDDLVIHLRTPASKIDVVPLGLGQVARATPLSESQIRARFDLGDRPVLLSLSAKRPQKNLASLLRALALLETTQRPVLVLPGYRSDHEAELQALADELGVAHDIRWPDWLSPEELEGLFSVARAFVFPSLYEGFGLPVLEAMARGVPVACSNVSSLPEVVGDAALLFDPHDPQSITDALGRLLADDVLRDRLATAGPARATTFSWERCARETVTAYERSLASSRS